MSMLITRCVLSAAFVLAALLAAVASAAPAASSPKPAIELATKNVGKVIATPTKLGIYYWDTEKKSGGTIRCTGACAVEWPPVFVQGIVPRHVAGVMATFGTIKRSGRRQLTVNGLPAYTYRGDTAGVVKCDNVNGWHVARPQ